MKFGVTVSLAYNQEYAGTTDLVGWHMVNPL